MGENIDRAVIFFTYLISFLSTGVTSANLSWFGKRPLSNKVLKILVSIEMQESTQRFSIAAGISPVRFAFFHPCLK